MPKSAPPNTAAIYCRISRDWTGEGVGVARQEASCRELAQRSGLSVVEVYVDNDLGASDRTHKGKVRHSYQRMLDDARARRFSHIVAYSNSRLTRRMLELEELITLHESTGVQFQTVVSGNDDLSRADGRMTARLKASIDAGESDRISERQKAAFLHRAMQGEPKLQRQRPFGWKKDGKTIEAEEAELIRDAVKKIIAGKSITALAKEWEEAGILTAAGGSKWNWNVLRKILVGWRTAGVRTYRRKPLLNTDGSYVMGTWEQIITLEERDAALAALGKRSLKKVRQGTWLLTGLVRCGVCGGVMYGAIKADQATTSYTCKNGGHNAITAHKLEWFVLSAVFTHVLERNQKEAESSGINAPSEPQEFPQQARLEEVTVKMTELMDAYNSGALSGDIVFAQVDRLDRERKEISQAREVFYASQEGPLHPLESSEEIWSLTGTSLFDLSDDDQALAVRRELEGVVVKKGKRGRAGWGADALLGRLEFLWRDGTGSQVATISRAVADGMGGLPDHSA